MSIKNRNLQINFRRNNPMRKTRKKESASVDSPEDKPEAQEVKGFPVVGIGASAGGLEAMEQFFSNMPVNSEMAFVVIQHLSPDHKALLSEILQRATEMPVMTVKDRMKVKPNSVYVIPSNKSMSILNGSLHLFDPVETQGLRLPIDLFLRSLADDKQGQSIGIILSGMGSDGSMGVKAIKEKEGMVLVQDPASAKFDSMPRSAIETVMVDIVAPANELPAKLIALTRQAPRLNTKEEIEKDSSALEKIIILLRIYTGNDFSQYKKTTMYRRIERRMGIHQLKKIALYVRYLQENPVEIDILFKELLIGVTSFFRDTTVWELLEDQILPSVFEKLSNKYKFRVWIPGCSTGEEAYSLAIVFKEVMEKTNMDKSLSLQIFATDLDSYAIEKARKGIYPANIVADVSEERLHRFFRKADDQYRINTEIREMVVFASQNVIKDPPFTKLDMLSCRNLLIYMDEDLQKKLLELFHFGLNPGGLLLLGSAERAQTELFSTVNSKLRIYHRTGLAKNDELFNFPGSFSHSKSILMENQIPAKIPDNIQTLTDQLLLQQFSPACVLVTDKGDILYLTGNIGKYLSPAAGKANMNLFAMAHEGLRNVLPDAFRKAIQSFERVVLPNVKVINGGTQLTDVIIKLIEKPPALKNKVLVIFDDVPEEKQKSAKQKKEIPINNTSQTRLKFELQRVKEELEGTLEEMQTSQEELKSTNEELQSTNEELQSANEELTTSREEMQSMNEELQTMNVALQSKIEDSVRINNDMNNLFNSIEIATLFLDRDLNIRQFTFPATKIFKLKQSDVGRLFTDQVTDLVYPEMYNHAREVLRTLLFIEKSVSSRYGRWFNVRIMPYRTFEDKIDGLVITFIDNTKTKRLEDSQMILRSVVDTLTAGVLGLTADGVIGEFNNEAEILLGCKRDEVIGKNYFNLFVLESVRDKVETDLKKLCDGVLPNRYENHIITANGDELRIEWSAHKLADATPTLIGLIKIGPNTT